MKLYEITQNYNNLLELLDNPEVPSEILKESLDQVKENFNTKAENICKLLKNMEAEVRAFKEEEKRLSDRRKTTENKIKSLKDYLESSMRAVEVDKVKGSVFTLSIQNNPPSIEIENENAIPNDYIQIEKVLDKKAMLRAIKEGIEVPGVTLKQTKGLRIR